MSVKSEVSNWKFSTFLENNNNKFNKNDILNVLTKQDMDEAYQTISGWDKYSPTPLISLNKYVRATQPLCSTSSLTNLTK